MAVFGVKDIKDCLCFVSGVVKLHHAAIIAVINCIKYITFKILNHHKMFMTIICLIMIHANVISILIIAVHIGYHLTGTNVFISELCKGVLQYFAF